MYVYVCARVRTCVCVCTRVCVSVSVSALLVFPVCVLAFSTMGRHSCNYSLAAAAEHRAQGNKSDQPTSSTLLIPKGPGRGSGDLELCSGCE